MPRLGISKLAMPSDEYRIDIHHPEFEAMDWTLGKVKVALRITISAGKKVEAADGLPLPRNLRRLIKHLTKETTSKKPRRRSLACNCCMRDLRIRVIGHAAKLFDDTGESKPTTVHVMPRKWEILASKLNAFDPRKLIAEFLTDLNRVGGLEADGYIIAFIHCEFNPYNRKFKFHLHGLLSGGMRQVVHSLKKTAKYKTHKPERASIFVRKAPITCKWTALSYLLKSYWPSRYVGPGGKAKLNLRALRATRINEPYHTQALLWQDQWALEDITLLKNVRVAAGGNGFVPTKLYSYPTNYKSKKEAKLGAGSNREDS